MSPTPDSTLDPQQVIGDLKRQLAESNAERDEAQAQKAAIAEILEVINSSPGDLAPVFDALLTKAMHLCDVAFGTLRLYDGERFHLGASQGASPALLDFQREPLQPGLGAARMLAGEDVVNVPDIIDGEAYRSGSAAQRALVELGGARSNLAVALRRGLTLLGYISVYRREVRPFTDKQIALLQNFAAQAVIAMENARLITETREALDQQTATAEVLGVINTSLGELAPVFNAMLDRAMRLCEAAFGSLWTLDGDRFRPAAHHGLPPRYAEYLADEVPAAGPGTGRARLLAGEPFAHIADLADEEPYRTGEPHRRALVDLGGARTALLVPLRRDATVSGFIMIYRQEVRPFTDKQIALLQNFAAQAVIAMENARLITETREALEQQTATAEVLGVINSSPGDLAPVFDAMLEKAMRLCGFDHGSLQTYDGQLFRAVAVRGLPEQLAEELRRGYHPELWPPTRPLVDGARLVHIPDLTREEQVEGVRLAVASGSRTLLFIPLRKDDALLGTIVAVRQEVRPFGDKQIALLQNFAAQAVVAMENARLITETREALEQQTATAEVLAVINSSPGDLTPVFDAILEKAHTLCGADHGTLTVFDGESCRAIAMRGIPEGFAEVLRQPFQPGGLTEKLSSGAAFVHIADLTEAQYSSDNPLHRAAIGAGGVRTLLAVPLRRENDVLLGYVTANRREVRPFTDKQIALLQNFAAQAVIAMENARLITETREALEQQTATAEVLGVINSSPGDLAPVFDAILEKAHSLCGATFGGLLIYDGDRFKAVALHNVPPAFAEIAQGFVATPHHPIARLLEGEPLVHIADLKEIAEVAPTGSLPRAGVDLAGIRTLLLVPLRKGDALLGVITAYRQEVCPFSDKQIALLQNFAAQAVIAMENARLLGELQQRTDEVGELNRGLEARVAEQVDELGRVGRLKRFLAPQLAELIVSHGDEKILESHRREIVVVFCDLRGYTAFTETAEPEEVLDFLRQYHGALGPLVSQFEGTLDQFSGDGIMVFFNDPVPCPDPAERAVKMAVAMRSAANTLIADWRERGRDLGFGAGIAQGYATLGQIGFSERSGYTAIGTVCNVAARLCAEAKDGQILLGQLVNVALRGSVATEQLGPLDLKGLSQPVVAYNVPLAASQPALRVIEGGPQSV